MSPFIHRVLSGTMLCYLAVTACAALGAETADSIAARETILMSAPLRWGRLSAEVERVRWEHRADLHITPTALYLTYRGGSVVISHALAESQVSDVVQWNTWPLGKPLTVADQLVVRMMRTNCHKGCVFDLGSRELAERAHAIIADGHRRLDPFGRLDGSRTAWLSAGFRRPAVYWTERAEMLRSEGSKQPETLRRKLEELSSATLTGYREGLAGALARDLGDWRFEPLPGLELNQKSELSARSLQRVLEDADPTVHRLLVSDVTALTLREQPLPDGAYTIVATFHLFVDYYDLHPAKDGRYFLEAYSVARPAEEWLQLEADDFAGHLENLSIRVSGLIQRDLLAAPDRTTTTGEIPNDPPV